MRVHRCAAAVLVTRSQKMLTCNYMDLFNCQNNQAKFIMCSVLKGNNFLGFCHGLILCNPIKEI